MKAIIAHTTEGRTKIILDGTSANIIRYFENLGGKEFDGFWIFPRRDAGHAIESLREEGYSITTEQLL